MKYFIATAILLLTLSSCQKSTEAVPPQQQIDETIIGALAYLDDTQIRQRAGRRSCLSDSYEEEGCINDTQTLPGASPFPIPNRPDVKNRNGEWASFIYHLPHSIHNLGLSQLRTQDSALIVSAFITYPLFLFEKSSNPKNISPVDTMLDLSIQNLKGFKRGTEYSFWPQIEPSTIPSLVSPYNIDIQAVDQMLHRYMENPDDPFFKMLFGKEIIAKLQRWVRTCLTDTNNSSGVYALFNIPNDADDLSMATAIFKLYAQRHHLDATFTETDSLLSVARFRDSNRTKEDGRDAFKGSQSGAYLTWLKDENAPLFANPQSGIIPLGVNNVDAVVNANVLFALALHDINGIKGFDESIDLLVHVIETHAWPEAALYYPQHMMFPYAVTRAWRDAGLRTPELHTALKTLMHDLLQEQHLEDPKNSDYGTFDGGEDKTRDLSTALGCTALLNMGEGIAREADMLLRYRQGIDACISRLVAVRKPYRFENNETFAFASQKPRAWHWEEGLFFSASVSRLVQWRSQSLTTAMVLETLTKYRLRYHQRNSTLIQAHKLILCTDPDRQDLCLRITKTP